VRGFGYGDVDILFDCGSTSSRKGDPDRFYDRFDRYAQYQRHPDEAGCYSGDGGNRL
jgi:hypothetical protein